MSGIVAWVLMLLAVFSWVIAVIAAIQVVRLAPKGQRLRTYGQLGWWRFDDIRNALGEAVSPHIMTYKRAVVAFLVLIVAGLVLASLVSTQIQNQVA